jgi:acetyl-CoA carboxylase biotin carboxylase subunit
MNTRLQVEHPVTEMVTGLDLVKLQIAVARGDKLGLQQDDVVMRGASMECRIYAEDPDNNFFPSPGKIMRLRTPSGPGVRDDSGVYEGWTVPIDYDPLISKLATWGSSRGESMARMQRALREYKIDGIKSNIGFFLEVLRHPDFQKGDFDTGFIDRFVGALYERPGGRRAPRPADRTLAAIAAAVFHSQRQVAAGELEKQSDTLWKLDARRRGLRSS